MTSSTECLIEREVDRLFNEMGATRGDYCRNPITGASFVWGVDPIGAQKRDAVRALRARELFAENGPPDAPPLPLSHDEIEDAKNARGLTRVVGSYARSLAARDWNLPEHPSFDDFARGLMASNSGWNLQKDEQLRRRFPPRSLEGMGPDQYWRPPAEHQRIIARSNRSLVLAA
jgi:hypothetical protein